MENILTNEDYKKILQERFGSLQIEFRAAEWSQLSENVEGFMGDHFILKIRYKVGKLEDSENFFIKNKPKKTGLHLEIVNKFHFYEKEILYYDNLFREFEKRGYYTGFAPKAYYCKNMETLVMEDLTTKGFILSGKRNFYDLNHCKAALRALAYYHANTISYEEERSKELGKEYRVIDENPSIFTENFFIKGDKESAAAKYMQGTMESLKQLCELLPETEQWQEEFVRKLESYDGPAIFWTPLPYRKTFTHGDLWSNNMLFRYSDGVPTHCCLVDFQASRYYHPSYDALLVIYSNSLRAFRKQHLQDLLQYYYSTFEEILKDNGFSAKNILPWDHFIHSANHLKSIACVRSVIGRTLTLMPTEVTNKAANAEGDGLEDLMFLDRPRTILKAFQQDEGYRNILTDDIYDLYEHL